MILAVFIAGLLAVAYPLYVGSALAIGLGLWFFTSKGPSTIARHVHAPRAFVQDALREVL